MKTITTCFTVFSLLVFLATAACSGGSNNVGTSASNPSSRAFPQGLTITSPLDTEEESSSLTAAMRGLRDRIRSKLAAASAGETIEEEIDAIINGDSIDDCGFSTQNILQLNGDAECYGPTVSYLNHPDYDPAEPGPGADGELPHGDVGIWRETEDGTEACAAAELNAQLNGIQQKTTASLMAFAGMICVSNVNGISLPENSTSDLTAEMNDMADTNGIDVEFESATLTHDDTSGEDEYSYEIAFSFNDTEGDSHDAVLQMTHLPDEDLTDSYRGRFSYAVNVTVPIGGNCPSTEQTYAGSVLYDREDESNTMVQAMDGTWCGSSAEAVGADGLVDPDDTYNPGTNLDGWANNFTVFTTTADAEGIGNYSMAWQAGHGDDKSRVFNVSLSWQDEGETVREATAYFGFGDPVNGAGFDGGIDGFICSWAGPGHDESSHDTVDLMQRQTMSDTSGLFSPVDSDIGYAPTLSCDYDPAADGAGFEYDLDGDGAIEAGETTDVGDGIANELADLSELDFTLPTAPENF